MKPHIKSDIEHVLPRSLGGTDSKKNKRFIEPSVNVKKVYNTPSSETHYIVTGYQVFSAIAEYLEKQDTYCCNRVFTEIINLLNKKVIFNGTEKAASFAFRHEDFFIYLIFAYFAPEKTCKHSVIWGLNSGEDSQTERIIAMTILAEICKEKQIKLYIPRK